MLHVECLLFISFIIVQGAPISLSLSEYPCLLLVYIFLLPETSQILETDYAYMIDFFFLEDIGAPGM